ncbi:MAG: glycosyltransferase family 2 protein [Patescibacteria group bacterium]
MSKIDLSIIVVSYNTAEITLQTLESLIKELKSSKKLLTTQVLLVDNNSNDNSADLAKILLKSHGCIFEVIRNKENLGFAAANNQAIKIAKGELILLLNSDTLLKPKALEMLVSCFETQPWRESTAHLESAGNKIDHLGIVAAQLLNPDGSVQPQGGSLPCLKAIACHMLMLDDLPWIGKHLPSTQHTGKSTRHQQHSGLIIQDWVGGTAMMIRREMLDEIGILDSNIFMYGEDVEFCLRAKNHHWDIAIHPNAKVVHLGSASSSSANAIMGELKGYVYIWKKHMPDWQLPLLLLLIKLGAMLRILVFGTILRDKKRRDIYNRVLREI